MSCASEPAASTAPASKYAVPRPAADLCARIRRARGLFRLTLVQMAAELRIRPEWLSKLLNGHETPSYNIGLRFDDFLRRRAVDPETFARDAADAAPAENGAPVDALRKNIERACRQLVAAAGDDVGQLSRIAAQMAILANGRPRRRAHPAPLRVVSPAEPKTPAPFPPEPEPLPPEMRRELLVERHRALAQGRHR